MSWNIFGPSYPHTVYLFSMSPKSVFCRKQSQDLAGSNFGIGKRHVLRIEKLVFAQLILIAHNLLLLSKFELLGSLRR